MNLNPAQSQKALIAGVREQLLTKCSTPNWMSMCRSGEITIQGLYKGQEGMLEAYPSCRVLVPGGLQTGHVENEFVA